MSFPPVLEGIVANEDAPYICPIRYLHNPLPHRSRPPSLPPLSYPEINNTVVDTTHSTAFHPLKVVPALPYYSAIPFVYESRFWRHALRSSSALIYLLSLDKSPGDISMKAGVTMRTIARKELNLSGKGGYGELQYEDKCWRSVAYMFPFCKSEERMEVIACCMVVLFLFDDKGERADTSEFQGVTEDYLKRMSGELRDDSPFQVYLNSVIKKMNWLDEQRGNGGREVHAELKKLFDQVPAPTTWKTVTAYLEFRRNHICNGWVFASVKFSMASSVDIAEPRFKKFLDLASEHMAITNDLYSYAKEKQVFKQEDRESLLNIVSVIAKVDRLEEGVALERATEMLREREQIMLEELGSLHRDNREVVDGDEDLEFLSAVWACVAGHVFFCMTTERYGGEVARIVDT